MLFHKTTKKGIKQLQKRSNNIYLFSIAYYIHNKQLEIIKKELIGFLYKLKKRIPDLFEPEPTFIITGLSADFLIRKVLEKLNYNKIKYYNTITNIPNNVNSSAFAVAVALLYKHLKMVKK